MSQANDRQATDGVAAPKGDSGASDCAGPATPPRGGRAVTMPWVEAEL